MQLEIQNHYPIASQYSLVKATIEAAARFQERSIVQRDLSFCTMRQLRREGYQICRQGNGGTRFLVITW